MKTYLERESALQLIVADHSVPVVALLLDQRSGVANGVALEQDVLGVLARVPTPAARCKVDRKPSAPAI